MSDADGDRRRETSRLELLAWTLVFLVPLFGLLWEFGTALMEPGSRLRTLLSTVEAHRLEDTVPIGVVSNLESTIFGLALVLGGGVLVVFIYATLRYSSTLTDRPDRMATNWIRGSFLGWFTLVVAVFVVTGFMSGAVLLNTEGNPTPSKTYDTEGQVTYTVVGVQWTWMMNAEHLAHPMRRTMYVPANTTVHLKIKSKDVIHSFAVQAFGVKKDAVPGQTNEAYFVARDPGRYQVNCAELCGAGHSQMTPTLVVLPRDEYAEWVVEHGGENPFPDVTVGADRANGLDANDPQTGAERRAKHRAHDDTHARANEVTEYVRT
ncbi:MAG: hypothetical protein ABEJ04_02445 [Halobacteriaceae archaeon]